MLRAYLYIFLEMLLIVFIVNSLCIAVKHVPSKIKSLAIVVLALSLLKILSNIILFASDNIIFLYILRFFNTMNLAFIPIIALLSLYIFYRSESLKFDYVICLSVIVFAAYLITVFKMEYSISRTELFGYTILLKQWVYVELAFISIMSIILITSIITIGRNVSNNMGLMLIIIASTITIGEIVLKILGIKELPNLVISDAVWILVIQYALSTVKTSKGR